MQLLSIYVIRGQGDGGSLATSYVTVYAKLAVIVMGQGGWNRRVCISRQDPSISRSHTRNSRSLGRLYPDHHLPRVSGTSAKSDCDSHNMTCVDMDEKL